MLLPSGRDIGGNIESWAIKSSKEGKLRERVYKGIPDRWRNAAWDLLMSRFSRLGKLEATKLVNDYVEAIEKPSSYDIQIDLDVPRTISGHVMFHTRYGAGYVREQSFSVNGNSSLFFFYLANEHSSTSSTPFHSVVQIAATCKVWAR
jgi:hypothetical protein